MTDTITQEINQQHQKDILAVQGELEQLKKDHEDLVSYLAEKTNVIRLGFTKEQYMSKIMAELTIIFANRSIVSDMRIELEKSLDDVKKIDKEQQKEVEKIEQKFAEVKVQFAEEKEKVKEMVDVKMDKIEKRVENIVTNAVNKRNSISEVFTKVTGTIEQMLKKFQGNEFKPEVIQEDL